MRFDNTNNMKNYSGQKMSLGKRILLSIGLATAVAANQGCVQGTVIPEVGYHQSTNQRGGYVEFEPGIVYGIKTGIKTSKGIEAKIEYETYDTVYKDEFQRNDLTARDLSASISVPLYDNGRVSVQVKGRITARTEDESAESVVIPGLKLGEDSRTSTGFGVGVAVEGKVGPGNLGGEIMAESFSDGSYEKSGWKAKVFYKVFISPVKRK